MNEKKKVLKKTCCLAKTVIKKTQELFEISQLKLKIIQVKNKIERKYVKIGYFLYNKQKINGFDSLKKEVEDEKLKTVFCELDELYLNLAKLEEQCDEIKRYVKKEEKGCIKCGCDEKNVETEKENSFEEDEKKPLNEKDYYSLES